MFKSSLINTNEKINIKIEMFWGTEYNKRMNDGVEQAKKIENYYYSELDKIGQGNFSQVFRGMDQNNGMHVAIKVIKYSSLTTKIAQQLLKSEINILKQLNHPNILKCHNVFSSKNNCYIVTDFYEGGDLQKLIFNHKFMHQKNIGRIVYEVYSGLLYLHQLNIIHRDFKPANIFLDGSGSAKIADFGFAIKFDKTFKDISIGSPIYMSPEGLILHEYGPKTDVWAFGIMIYEMLHGQTPLSKCRNQKQLKQKVLLPPSFRQGISPQLRKMIDSCLTVDPKYRIDIKQLANTAYLSKIISEVEGKADLTCTYHTKSTKRNIAVEFVKQVKTYEEGLALLQYCRLVHKTCEKTPSPILSQWLLNLCDNLQKIAILHGDKQQNEKLILIIRDYYVKYSKEHHDSHIDVACQQVIMECQNMINKMQGVLITPSALKTKLNNLMMLLRQSQMLLKFGDANKINAYSKASQVEKYLDSLKKNLKKTMSSIGIINNQNIKYGNK